MHIFYFGQSFRRLALMLLLAFLSIRSMYSHANAIDQLSLQQAVKQTLQLHPQLQVFYWQKHALTAQQHLAALNSGYALQLTADEMLGTGERTGMNNSELTIALSSVFELGDKRTKRLATVNAAKELLYARQQAASLDLLGEVTQRYIAVLTLQQKQQLAYEALRLSEQALQQVQQRVEAAVAPEAELWRAEVAVRQTQLQLGAIQGELASSKMLLASLWGGGQSDFNEVSGSLFTLASSPDFEVLYQRFLATPQLQIFAAEQRLQNAQYAQLQSQSVADLSWQVGISRSFASNDFALQAGISIPLFSQARNQNLLDAAQASAAAEVALQQEQLLKLRARLYQAWQQHRYAMMTVRDLQQQVIPLLEKALAQTEVAYLTGRYSYTDWLSARQSLQEARWQLLDAASTALSNQALIEQISGLPLEQSNQGHSATYSSTRLSTAIAPLTEAGSLP